MSHYTVFSLETGQKIEAEFKERKLERLKAVRKQENALSKRRTEESKLKMIERSRENVILAKYEDYQQKIRLIEQLSLLKSQNIEEIGQAQKAAEESQQAYFRLCRENEEKKAENERKAKERGFNAEMEAKRRLEERNREKNELFILKKEIKDQENEIAHQMAQEYREKPKEKYVEGIFEAARLEKNKPKMKKRLDFKHTHFHNPLIQFHGLDEDKENGVLAMELANREYEKISQIKREKETLREKSKEKAKERGEKALKVKKNEEKSRKFEKTLEKAEMEANKRKVEQERKAQTIVVKKTVTVGNTRKTEEKRLEKAFFETFAAKSFKIDNKSKAKTKGNQTKKPCSASAKDKKGKKERNSSLFIDKSQKNNSFSSPKLRTGAFLDSSFSHSIIKNPFLDQEPAEISLKNSQNSEKKVVFSEEKQEKNEENQEKNFKALENEYFSHEKNLFSNEKGLKSSENGLFSNEKGLKKSENCLFSNEIPDIQGYIREQEAYLARLESERMKISRNKSYSAENMAFIEELHKKEHQFVENQGPKGRADELIGRFLGEKAENKPKIGENCENEVKKWDASELSYSISQENSPEKSRIFIENTLRKPENSPSSFEKQEKNLEKEESHRKNTEKLEKQKKNIEKQENEAENELENSEKLPLSELFKQKRAKLLAKMTSKQEKTVKSPEKQANLAYKPRSKEEILRLRREIMKKPAFLDKKVENEDENQENKTKTTENEEEAKKGEKQQKTKKEQLMERLAMGMKSKVDRKEMRALNEKTYGRLPEVQKRKEEENKREEYRKRQKNMKKLEKRVREEMMRK